MILVSIFGRFDFVGSRAVQRREFKGDLASLLVMGVMGNVDTFAVPLGKLTGDGGIADVAGLPFQGVPRCSIAMERLGCIHSGVCAQMYPSVP